MYSSSSVLLGGWVFQAFLLLLPFPDFFLFPWWLWCLFPFLYLLFFLIGDFWLLLPCFLFLQKLFRGTSFVSLELHAGGKQILHSANTLLHIFGFSENVFPTYIGSGHACYFVCDQQHMVMLGNIFLYLGQHVVHWIWVFTVVQSSCLCKNSADRCIVFAVKMINFN